MLYPNDRDDLLKSPTFGGPLDISRNVQACPECRKMYKYNVFSLSTFFGADNMLKLPLGLFNIGA